MSAFAQGPPVPPQTFSTLTEAAGSSATHWPNSVSPSSFSLLACQNFQCRDKDASLLTQCTHIHADRELYKHEMPHEEKKDRDSFVSLEKSSYFSHRKKTDSMDKRVFTIFEKSRKIKRKEKKYTK